MIESLTPSPNARLGPLAFGLVAILMSVLGSVAMAADEGAADEGAGDAEIVAAVTAHFPPYYITNDAGETSGFAIDVMNAVAEKSGLKVRYVIKNKWSDVTAALTAGEVDIIPNVGITAERKAWANFTTPVESYPVSIFVRKETTSIRGLNTLAGKKVAVVQGNSGQTVLRQRGDVVLRAHANNVNALFSLLSGEVDAFVYPQPVVWHMARQARIEDQIQVVGEPLLEIKRAIAVRKDKPALFQTLSQSADAFAHSEQYHAIYAKWFAKPVPFWTQQKIFWLLIGGAFIVLFAAVLTTYLLRLNRNLREEITTRKALQEDLNRQFEIYEEAINTPALGFWVVNTEGRLLSVNEAYAKQSGYNREELLQLSIPDLEALQSPQEVAANIGRVIDAGHARFRTVHRRKDGTNWPVEIVVTFSKLQGGLFIAFIEDITKKVEQEAHLEQAARVYDVMDQAVVVTDANNAIVSTNPAALRITGFDLDELLGKDPKIFASGRHDDAFYEDMWKALQTSGHWEGDIWDKRKNGDVYPKHLSIHVIEDAHGKPIQYVSVFSDITVRKQAESDLLHSRDILEGKVAERTRELTAEIEVRRQTEAELRKLTRAVEQSAHMIFITDINGVIEYINPKFTEWMGYSPAEAIGQRPSLIQSGDTSEEVYNALWATIMSGGEWHGELKDRRKDGSIFWASAAIAPVRDEHDNITHFIAVHEDITLRKETELAMHEARRAAELANKAKTDLMANMSHELRTPLNAIIGFSETMTNAIFGPMNNAHYEEYAGYIHSSGTHLLQLINDILDVSAVEAGKLNLHEQEVSVSDVCDTAVQILQTKATEHQIELKGLSDRDLPLLYCDPLRLKQIFINLLSNAVKFTPEGGSVSCDAHLTEARDLIITITDTGIGMDEDGMRKALDKFGQVDSSLSRAHEGTGLGLPLTKGLVELHGGSLELKSVPEQGTTVTLLFPASRVIA